MGNSKDRARGKEVKGKGQLYFPQRNTSKLWLNRLGIALAPSVTPYSRYELTKVTPYLGYICTHIHTRTHLLSAMLIHFLYLECSTTILYI